MNDPDEEEPPTWIGRTEIKELVEDGEAMIAGDRYELTGAAAGWLRDRLDSVERDGR